MEQFAEGESTHEEIKNKLRQNFDGKIVRKDLTKKIKEVSRGNEMSKMNLPETVPAVV